MIDEIENVIKSYYVKPAMADFCLETRKCIKYSSTSINMVFELASSVRNITISVPDGLTFSSIDHVYM